MDNRTWFKQAQYGMMAHFGLYSMLAGEYRGRRVQTYAEWIQCHCAIPNAEYHNLAKVFNPVYFDADEWIRLAKEAGMKYFVITSKHHDGFALFKSKDPFNVVDATPFKRDIIGELAAACRKRGVKFGVYYSHWLDWEGVGGDISVHMENDEYIHPTEAEFAAYWQNKCLPQVEELLINYAPDLFWFDTWDDAYSRQYVTKARQQELVDLIRSYKEDTLISSRIQMLDPIEDIDFISCHDNQFPEKGFNKPWETSGTLNESWGYHREDFSWKSTEVLLKNLISNAAIGGNYQLNVGPDGSGRFSPAALRRLTEMGAWLTANGEALYGSEAGSGTPPWGRETVKGNKRFLTVYDVNEPITLTGEMPDYAYISETNQPVTVKQEGDTLTVELPEAAKKLSLPVIVLER